MPHLQPEGYELIERALFLPMVITILNRDLGGIEKSSLKLKHPYIQLINESLKIAQKDLIEVRKELRKRKIAIHEAERDEAFTLYLFVIDGYEEKHRYFNPRIREQVSSLLTYYLFAPDSP
ncbi:hypothetical protein ACUUYQ_05595 [Bacillus halotolerans]|uniref:YhjD n=1 Tax=Bacillus halotolerans TaxID=260554 RepID=A0A9Q4HPQ3_9BACI|nr:MULTISPECIES: hypothetical protein [Bacillus]MBV7319484.1 hypothetical protein [Halalkalibacterium halodurans]AZV48335.1 hypothetical protein DIC78_04375 [Bacillus halotolerans]MBU5246427.1 hypothetical protein [Bacillus halotolerans]MCP9299086.1 hypothetical protein [Bacillus halotolerans]MCV0024932.1 hypothetical protein [Bacillus sp. XT-2]